MRCERLRLLVPALLALSLSSCGSQDYSDIAFGEDDLVQSSFGGLGVEWGVYEDTDMLDENSFKRIYANIKELAPARIRCMFNYDSFVKDFDDKGDDDKTNDTWTYDFANKWGDNLFEILRYCQSHGIQVATGAWNVIGDLRHDVWGMMDECTADLRWAKISADIFDYLINVSGFTCIRWFVNGNEPNYTGSQGSSKNYNNTLDKWIAGVKNVRAALDAKGLTEVGIIGGDTTGFDGTREYWTGIANRISDKVADYGAHFYLSNYYIDGGYVREYADELVAAIRTLDKGYGTSRPLDVWECGLLDGKVASTDSNSLIKTVSYGVRMADFTIQTMLSGFNSLTYWSFDDAQNMMYSGNASTPKMWGMFSSLSSATSYNQELRPWYHSSCLLTHLFSSGSKIYGNAANSREIDDSFRCIAAVSKDGKSGGYCAINRGTEATTRRFLLGPAVEGSGKLYVYEFGEGLIKLGEDGFIEPNYEIEGSLNKWLSLSVPSNSLVVVSSEEL
ncbi:MAG: hypothetical protein LKG11_06735 [Bacilli bacterium]|nr:hypothetical protein [Bacilli bacterium]